MGFEGSGGVDKDANRLLTGKGILRLSVKQFCASLLIRKFLQRKNRFIHRRNGERFGFPLRECNWGCDPVGADLTVRFVERVCDFLSFSANS